MIHGHCLVNVNPCFLLMNLLAGLQNKSYEAGTINRCH